MIHPQVTSDPFRSVIMYGPKAMRFFMFCMDALAGSLV